MLQADGTLTGAELGEAVGLAPTSAWRRVQKLQQQGVIERRVALLDPESLNLGVTALVEVRTGDHSAAWLDRFTSGIAEFPEIVAAWRTSGEVDYMLRAWTETTPPGPGPVNPGSPWPPPGPNSTWRSRCRS